MWTLDPHQDGSLLPSAVVTSYCTYLLYSALASEPSEYECNPRGSETGAGAGSRGGVAEIASTALTLASVAYGALRCVLNTGSHTTAFSW